jgi:hypothetical protein
MSPAFIVIDFESYYDQQYSLKKMTPVEYILDPRFECMGASITEGNDGVPFWLDADQLPAYLESKRGLPIPFISHNALFDMCLLAWRFGFIPYLMVDTMAMARAMVYAYTGSVSLEAVAAYLGLGVKTKTILKVAGMSAAAIKAAGLWQEYIDYACNDGALCRDIFKALRVDFPRSEYEVVDHVIRAAAIPRFVLNRDKLALHAHQIEQDKATLLARTGLADRDALMSNPKFATALESLGVTPPMKISPTTGEEAYAFAKTDAGMIELEEHENPDVQALVAARLGFKSTLEETRTKRFQAIANLTWPGKEPLPWMPMPLRYCGAHTSRLSGDWKLNVQNLGRASMLREALEAPPGYKVVVVDASQIEARFNPYFAGQDDLVEAFRQGRDVYSEFASEEVYRRPVNKKEHPRERFVGKVSILQLGYQAGGLTLQKAIRNQSRAQGEEIRLELTDTTSIVQAYRRRYSKIAGAWKTMQDALPVLANQDSGFEYGPFKFRHQKIVGPNGLCLFYHELRQELFKGKWQWRFKYGREWKSLYGGKLIENIIQHAARIHTMEAASRASRRFHNYGLTFVNQVHDELVFVVPDAVVSEFLQCLIEELSTPPGWAPGIPLAAEGNFGMSYAEAK